MVGVGADVLVAAGPIGLGGRLARRLRLDARLGGCCLRRDGRTQHPDVGGTGLDRHRGGGRRQVGASGRIGDFLGLPPEQGGIGLGTLWTSVLFLGAILAIVVYLTLSKADREPEGEERVSEETASPGRSASVERQRVALGMLGVVAFATVSLLAYTDSLPHQSALADEGTTPTCTAATVPLTPDQARTAVQAHFPADQVASFRTITDDTLALVQQGDQAGAKHRVTDLETAWDDAQDALGAADCQAWASSTSRSTRCSLRSVLGPRTRPRRSRRSTSCWPRCRERRPRLPRRPRRP